MKSDIVVLDFENMRDIAQEMERIGCDPGGIRIMSPKGVFFVMRISNLRSKAANLLKQAFLSQGGDVAVAKGCADLSVEYTEGLIMATLKQYKVVIPKLRLQPWGLANLADMMDDVLREKNDPVLNSSRSRIVGVIDTRNISEAECLKKFFLLCEQGADAVEFIIDDEDMPKSENISWVYTVLREASTAGIVPIAVSTAQADVAEQALANGVSMIRDWSGIRLVRMAEILATANVPIILGSCDEILSSGDFMKEIQGFLQKSICMCRKNGIQYENIIIDPGLRRLGNLRSVMKLSEQLEQIKLLGYPLIVDDLSDMACCEEGDVPGNEAAIMVMALNHCKGVRWYRSENVSRVKRIVTTLDLARSGDYDEDCN